GARAAGAPRTAAGPKDSYVRYAPIAEGAPGRIGDRAGRTRCDPTPPPTGDGKEQGRGMSTQQTGRRLFTSESVTEGHPDKICDAISDSILDAMLEADPASRVAVESLVTTGQVHVVGEVTTAAYVDI